MSDYDPVLEYGGDPEEPRPPARWAGLVLVEEGWTEVGRVPWPYAGVDYMAHVTVETEVQLVAGRDGQPLTVPTPARWAYRQAWDGQLQVYAVEGYSMALTDDPARVRMTYELVDVEEIRTRFSRVLEWEARL
ncbi:hypothetical protein SEA_WIDOW_50 [Gordonia phage Widow]|nr:hypothetical protein SEA_WIDOW_50 [Gordonia phage Widow]